MPWALIADERIGVEKRLEGRTIAKIGDHLPPNSNTTLVWNSKQEHKKLSIVPFEYNVGILNIQFTQ